MISKLLQDIINNFKGSPDLTYKYVFYENTLEDVIRLYYKDPLDRNYDLVLRLSFDHHIKPYNLIRLLNKATEIFIRNEDYIKRIRYLQFNKEIKEIVNG